MGILGSLKGKLHKKNDDLDELRSGVLDEPFRPEPMSTFNREQPRSDPFVQRSGFDDYPQRDASTDTMVLEPPTRESVSFEPQRGSEGSYEVLDRLRFIENQLSAIKSQTELINERLKNIEVKLGRPRY